jgi:hypothetical protein
MLERTICVCWIDPTYEPRQAIVTHTDLLALLSMLEETRLYYYVSDVRGFRLSQRQLGYGGLEHWLETGATFPSREQCDDEYRKRLGRKPCP